MTTRVFGFRDQDISYINGCFFQNPQAFSNLFQCTTDGCAYEKHCFALQPTPQSRLQHQRRQTSGQPIPLVEQREFAVVCADLPGSPVEDSRAFEVIPYNKLTPLPNIGGKERRDTCSLLRVYGLAMRRCVI
jgi:hypothetical protein